ncbi:MAG: HEAT repeat domain-containing protein [Candidatus Riflebacteria bacterium]|nr:HEAT repeat domain-containing protein [Candidatus Riflebacteria bacterium]
MMSPNTKVSQLMQEISAPIRSVRLIAIEQLIQENQASDEIRGFLQNVLKDETDEECLQMLTYALELVSQSLMENHTKIPDEDLNPENFKTLSDSSRLRILRGLTRKQIKEWSSQAPLWFKEEKNTLISALIVKTFAKVWPRENLQELAPKLTASSVSVRMAVLSVLVENAPDALVKFLPRLLTSDDPKLHIMAIRGLFKIDPQEALKHLEEFLYDDNQSAREIAIVDLFHFPFADIKSVVIKYFSIEDNLFLLEKAGSLFEINPDKEIPFKLWEIAERSGAEKAKLTKSIIQNSCKVLKDSGILGDQFDAYLERLQKWIRKRAAVRFLQENVIKLKNTSPSEWDEIRSSLSRAVENSAVREIFPLVFLWPLEPTIKDFLTAVLQTAAEKKLKMSDSVSASAPASISASVPAQTPAQTPASSLANISTSVSDSVTASAPAFPPSGAKEVSPEVIMAPSSLSTPNQASLAATSSDTSTSVLAPTPPPSPSPSPSGSTPLTNSVEATSASQLATQPESLSAQTPENPAQIDFESEIQSEKPFRCDSLESFNELKDSEQKRFFSSFDNSETAFRLEIAEKVLDSHEYSKKVRAAALRCCGKLKKRSCISIAEKWLNSSDADLQIGALNFLADIDKEMLDLYLSKFVHSSSIRVQLEAIRLLQKFDTKQALALIKTMLSNHNTTVQGAGLAAASSFDFILVRPLLVEFLGGDISQELFESGLCIFQANPDPESLFFLNQLCKKSIKFRIDLMMAASRQIFTELKAMGQVQAEKLADLEPVWEERLEKEKLAAAEPPKAYSLKALKKEEKQAKKIDEIQEQIAEKVISFNWKIWGIMGFLCLIIIGGMFVYSAPELKPLKQLGTPLSLKPADITGFTSEISTHPIGIYFLTEDRKKFLIVGANERLAKYQKGKKLEIQVSPMREYEGSHTVARFIRIMQDFTADTELTPEKK